MKVKVHVTLKNGVLDPQGKAVANALDGLGFRGVDDVRIGRYIELELDVSNPEEARQKGEEMCRKLLANTVIENYRIDVER